MRYTKLVKSLLLIMVMVVAAVGALDNVSHRYSEQALTRALATFAVARTLNGVISVAQGTEVALEPGGVGVMLTPGEILDPVNDLIERFSGVMLIAASSIGLQLILLEILSWWLVTAVLVALLAIWLAAIWSPGFREGKAVQWSIRVALIVTVLRFAVPVITIGSNVLFDLFLLSKQEASATELSASASDLKAISSDSGQAQPERSPDSSGVTDDGLFEAPDIGAMAESLKSTVADLYEDAADWLSSTKMTSPIRQLQERAADMTSHIINLIAIFLLQTVILPVGFLWLFASFIREVGNRSLKGP